jgi:hypothetical protein
VRQDGDTFMIRQLITLGILLLSGWAAFYYFDPLHIFSDSDKQVKEIVERDFDLTADHAQYDDSHGIPKEFTSSNVQEEKETVGVANSTSISLDSILTKYETTLQNLKTQVESRLEELMAHALEDYHKTKEEKGKVNLPLFYLKYKKPIDELEAHTDQTFQEIYHDLQEELRENGFNETEAEKLKQQYSQMKENTKAVMLEEVMEKFEV